MAITADVLVDFLTCSHPSLSVAEAIETFGLAGLHGVEVPGRYRYRKGLLIGGAVIFYDGWSENMGVCVSFSGDACRDFEGAGGEWREVIGRLLVDGWRVSRLDIAMDDRTGTVAVERIAAAARSGEVVSRCRGGALILDKVKGGAVTGSTVYVGSSASEVRVRAYDKALEAGEDMAWVRVEVQTRGERAKQFAAEFVAEGLKVCPSWIATYLDVRVRSATDKTVSRWARADWWDAFLGADLVAVPSLQRVAECVERTWAWLRSQVSTSLAFIIALERGSLGVVEELVSDRPIKFKPWQLRAITDMALRDTSPVPGSRVLFA